MKMAWCQQWEESERQWGQRPDGYSLHLSEQDAKLFATLFMERQREYFESKGISNTPDEYDRPAGSPYEVHIDDKVFDRINDLDGVENRGIRFHDKNYPTPVKDGGPYRRLTTSVTKKLSESEIRKRKK